MGATERPLAGGMAHPGEVVRVGDTVRRPSSPQSPAIFALLQHLSSAGFEGAPRPLGFDERGRETLAYIDGEVPVHPYPAWSMSDAALASVARLLRRYHDAVAGFDGSSHRWSDEMADPRGGPLICHSDVCPENVVFRNGEAVALLDFDFASPGRPLWDVVATVGMWAPLREPPMRAPGMEALDPVERTAIFADAYGLDTEERGRFLDVVVERQALRFVEGRVEAGEPLFIEMWEAQGGTDRRRRLRVWLETHRSQLMSALGAEV